METKLELNEQERTAIVEAVRAAEAGNDGEIVPYLVAASDRYEAASWRGAVLGAVICSAAAALVHAWAALWGLPAIWIVLPPVAGSLLGLLLVRGAPALRRRLVGEAILEREVRQRAAEAFLAEEVFRTRRRTGILLLISAFERRVVILADSGIHGAVPAAEWEAMASEVASAVRLHGVVAALLPAIARCGELLRERRPIEASDDSNELADGVRVGES